MHVVSWLMGLCLAAVLCLALVSVDSVHASSSGGVSLRKDLAFRVTDQLSAQTQAAVFPRRDVAFSLSHRVWTHASGPAGEAARQELGFLRLSQQVHIAGQPSRAFQRLDPSPLWADLLLEARVVPASQLQLSTTAAYHPATAQLARATAELRLQPLSSWTVSLAPDFGNGSQLEHLHGRMQLTLPGAWTVSYAMNSPALNAIPDSQTVTTRYRSSYGDVRLQLAQSSEEHRIGILLDLAPWLHRTLGF